MSQQRYKKLAAELRELYYQRGSEAEAIADSSGTHYDYRYDTVANKLYDLAHKRTPLTQEDMTYIEAMNRNYYSSFPASYAAGMPKKRGRPSKKVGGSTEGLRENMVQHAELIRHGYENLARDFPLASPLVHLVTPSIEKLYELTNRKTITSTVMSQFTNLYDELQRKLTQAVIRNEDAQVRATGSGKTQSKPKASRKDKEEWVLPANEGVRKSAIYESSPAYEEMTGIRSPTAAEVAALRKKASPFYQAPPKLSAAKGKKAIGTGKPRGRPRKHKVGGMEMDSGSDNEELANIFNRVATVVGAPRATRRAKTPIVRKRAAEKPLSGVKKYHIVGKGISGGAKSEEEARGYLKYLESIATTHKVNPGLDWGRTYAVRDLPKPLTFEEWKELQKPKKAPSPPPTQTKKRQRTVTEALMPK